VKLKIAWVGKTKEPAIQSLTDEYLKRLRRYTQVEGVTLKDETALTGLGGRVGRGQTPQTLVLLDSRGMQFSSEDIRLVQKQHDRI